MSAPHVFMLESEVKIGDIVHSKIDPSFKAMVVAFEIDQVDSKGIVETYRVKTSTGTGDIVYYYPIEIEKDEVSV